MQESGQIGQCNDGEAYAIHCALKVAQALRERAKKAQDEADTFYTMDQENTSDYSRVMASEAWRIRFNRAEVYKEAAAMIEAEFNPQPVFAEVDDELPF